MDRPPRSSLLCFAESFRAAYPPKNLLTLFFRNNLGRQKTTSKNKNNLLRLFLCFFQGYFWRVFKNNLRSRGHSYGRPGSKALGRPSKPWKNKHLGADIHHLNARTSMTPVRSLDEPLKFKQFQKGKEDQGRGVAFKAGSRHDRNRHNRRKRQNRLETAERAATEV